MNEDSTCACNECPYMKMNTMEKLYLCMLNETPAIEISEDLRKKALVSIERMLELS
jgi:quinolinate synthase